ncbi:hypothetical protein NDU88_010187 [Pleurodeles waltl]|uniref:Uncharacterized protein n=1 Tax=Pleurodeles waltl TaxID=8319 RepID=A0AAV7QZQ3_PLEWA|nr:hypothetical protein NDU88_010187 [Pleurodeles waltl]
MTGGKGARNTHLTKLEKYTLLKDPAATAGAQKLQPSMEQLPLEEEHLMLHDNMEAMHGVCASLEIKIDSVSTEVMLVRADLCHMGAKRTEVEDSITILKANNVTLKTQVSELCAFTKALEDRAADFEG